MAERQAARDRVGETYQRILGPLPRFFQSLRIVRVGEAEYREADVVGHKDMRRPAGAIAERQEILIRQRRAVARKCQLRAEDGRIARNGGGVAIATGRRGKAAQESAHGAGNVRAVYGIREYRQAPRPHCSCQLGRARRFYGNYTGAKAAGGKRLGKRMRAETRVARPGEIKNDRFLGCFHRLSPDETVVPTS